MGGTRAAGALTIGTGEEPMEDGMAGEANITAYPLAGYKTHSLKGLGVLLELSLVAVHPELGETEQSLPVQISASQARELAQDLLDAVAAFEMGQAPTSSRN
jgi:hypothetical protein